MASNAPGSPHSAPLSGTGLQPGLSLAPASTDFANQQVATTSAARAITVTNAGNAPLSVSGVTKAGTNPTNFTVTRNCIGTRVAPNGTCSVNVAFAPTATGARSAIARVASNAPGSPHSATLSGTGRRRSPAPRHYG